MILHGNQRGHARELALHLLNSRDNDRVEIHQLCGFVSESLIGALHEAHCVSRATKAKQFLYSLSLNPPADVKVPTATFEKAIDQAEERLGLSGQPRAIVFHSKHGRRHAHVVWSRIKVEEGRAKAVPLPFTKRTLMGLARELFIEHQWSMPQGLMKSGLSDPRNYSLGEWQQAKRRGVDPKALKALFQDCWATSDSQKAFAAALSERGLLLAKGDRRGFVAVDTHGEVYAIAKWVGLKTKVVREKLIDPKSLPSVQDAKATLAAQMQARLKHLGDQEQSTIRVRLNTLQSQRQDMRNRHDHMFTELAKNQKTRRIAESKSRQAKFNRGMHGLWDRMTGQHQKQANINAVETYQCQQRDQREKDNLIFIQLEQQQALHARMQRLQNFAQGREQIISDDEKQYSAIAQGRQDRFESGSSRSNARYRGSEPSM